jgi:hypothetical protein
MSYSTKSVKELRAICKEMGIMGYSNKNREYLIHFIDTKYRQINNLPRRLTLDDYEQMTVPQLKAICRERGIKGFSKQPKGYIIELIYYSAY